RPRPVLGREGEHGQPLEADLDATLHRVPEGLFAGAVAPRARQSALRRPAAVAVHHDRDVLGDLGPVDVVEVAAHNAVLTSIGTDFIRRSRWYSTKPNSSERERRRVRSSTSSTRPAWESSVVARCASSAKISGDTAAASELARRGALDA